MPSFGARTPEMTSKRVVFPAPFGPMIPSTSPRTASNHLLVGRSGQPVKRTYYEPVTSYQSIRGTPHRRTFANGDVKAFHPDGQAVEEKAMLDALQDGPKAVVLSTRAGGIDKALASVLKPDTPILVVPASKLDPATVEPGTDKIGR